MESTRFFLEYNPFRILGVVSILMLPVWLSIILSIKVKSTGAVRLKYLLISPILSFVAAIFAFAAVRLVGVLVWGLEGVVSDNLFAVLSSPSGFFQMGVSYGANTLWLAVAIYLPIKLCNRFIRQ